MPVGTVPVGHAAKSPRFRDDVSFDLKRDVQNRRTSQFGEVYDDLGAKQTTLSA